MSHEDEINELKEIIKGERVFLHDISNSLLIAQGMGMFVLGALKQIPGEGSKEYERMQKVSKAVDKMIELVQDRRSLLKSQTED